MATYTELSEIQSDVNWSSFVEKVRIAVADKAQDVIDSATPSQASLDWALAALGDKELASKPIIPYIILKNKTLTIATILAASDTAIYNNVSDAVDVLYP